MEKERKSMDTTAVRSRVQEGVARKRGPLFFGIVVASNV